MTKILSEDEKHAVFSSAYSEIVNDQNQVSTRAAAREEPTSDYAKSHACYNNSFLPKTISRDLRIGQQH